jgi:hypothetical protein
LNYAVGHVGNLLAQRTFKALHKGINAAGGPFSRREHDI